VRVSSAETRPEGCNRAAFTAWLETSCRRQGQSVTVRDPGVIAQVATLLDNVTGGRPAPGTHDVAKRRGRTPASGHKAVADLIFRIAAGPSTVGMRPARQRTSRTARPETIGRTTPGNITALF